jgi:hypothetical protein
MKLAAFWDVRRVGWWGLTEHRADGGSRHSQTSVNSYDTTRFSIPEGCHLGTLSDGFFEVSQNYFLSPM